MLVGQKDGGDCSIISDLMDRSVAALFRSSAYQKCTRPLRTLRTRAIQWQPSECSGIAIVWLDMEILLRLFHLPQEK